MAMTPNYRYEPRQGGKERSQACRERQKPSSVEKKEDQQATADER
ncbi:hypothetical protein [Mesorhizobium sp. B1-1-8]|nr:hypothetical protein [Mesorhizobium sp. B1-1-8]